MIIYYKSRQPKLQINIITKKWHNFNKLKRHMFKKILTKPNLVDSIRISIRQHFSIHLWTAINQFLSNIAASLPLFNNLKTFRVHLDVNLNTLLFRAYDNLILLKYLQRLPSLTNTKISFDVDGIISEIITNNFWGLSALKNNFDFFLLRSLSLVIDNFQGIFILNSDILLGRPSVFNNLQSLRLIFEDNAYISNECTISLEILSQMPYLKKFYFYIKNVSKWGISRLFKVMESLKNAKFEEFHLLLSDQNHMNSTFNEVFIPLNIEEVLVTLKNLKYLILTFLNIKLDDVWIATDKQQKLKLNELRLESSNIIGFRYDMNLMKKLIDTDHLQKVYIQNNFMNDYYNLDELNVLKDFMNIENLTLNFTFNVNKSCNIAERLLNIVKDIKSGLVHLKNLKMKFKNLHLKQKTCSNFMSILNSKSKLESLCFTPSIFLNSRTGKERLRNLIKHIKMNNILKKLIISVNLRKKENMIKLLQHIKRCYPNLKNLTLRVGFRAIWFKELKKNYQTKFILTPENI